MDNGKIILSTGAKLTGAITASYILEFLFPNYTDSSNDIDNWIHLISGWVQLSAYVWLAPIIAEFLLGKEYTPTDNFIYAIGFILQSQMIQKITGWYNSVGIRTGAPWESNKDSINIGKSCCESCSSGKTCQKQ